MRYGNLLAVHAFLELKLKDVCDLTKRFRNVRIDIKDLAMRGSDLARTRTFLENVMEIHIDPKFWEELQLFSELRNCIAHRSGLVDPKKDTWQHNATGQRAANVSVINGRLVLGPDSVESYLDASVNLFRALTNELNDWARLRAT